MSTTVEVADGQAIKIKGKYWRVNKSGRGYVTLTEKCPPHRHVTKWMDDDTCDRFSNDPVGWEKEMNRLVSQAISAARKMCKQK